MALAGCMGLEAVTRARLAQVAGVPEAELDDHASGAPDACVAAAYQELIERLQARFAARLGAARSREEGLRDAVGDLLGYLSRQADVAAFVTVEVRKGGRDLLQLREHLGVRSVANVRRALARYDGATVASDVQIEIFVAAMGHAIARYVDQGRTAALPGLLEPALAIAGACEPIPACG